MTKKAAGLTARQVQTARPGMVADGGGLYFRFRLNGRHRDMGLGSIDVRSLKEARQRAAEARKMVADGIDPIEARRHGQVQAAVAAARAMTFRQCAEVYIATQSAGWRSPKSLKAWEGTLAAYVYPIFGELPVAAVDIDIVTKALDPIWSTKPETASRVRGRIEAILDLATMRKYRSGDNPGRWRGHLEQALLAPAKAKRAVRQSNGRAEQLAALPFAEMPAFMAELRGKNGVAAARWNSQSRPLAPMK